MKAQLIPVYFMSGKNEDFHRQLTILKELLSEVADFLDPGNPGVTLEGHPAPLRAIILAERR